MDYFTQNDCFWFHPFTNRFNLPYKLDNVPFGQYMTFLLSIHPLMDILTVPNFWLLKIGQQWTRMKKNIYCKIQSSLWEGQRVLLLDLKVGQFSVFGWDATLMLICGIPVCTPVYNGWMSPFPPLLANISCHSFIQVHPDRYKVITQSTFNLYFPRG